MLNKMTFQVKSMRVEHTCGRTFDHGLANSTFLVERCQKMRSLIPVMKVSNLKYKVKNEDNVNISRCESYRAKKKAEYVLEGDEQP